ncbi:hypothetical protein ACWT_3576 [Actinoplanes sp. SE50]|uniref:hypothetical protein n=1 Tax=unclassified Actinoplanes TaxID=2626549 RepID=UPI00023EC0E9|nr:MULTISPECIES: hypothetical protein [unclassified Actinoplanes]AEV84599.1 hypothetical protein ACPL_3704 [Actinoplanes sp. SE50/110]ATO82991.1 hypothetical protein ACWT_3576 [Actinoplanes sp. SE50]SLM00399.1 hypothetical protein ACSP50_3631 [Actinoplanes sp. SE50/110]
MAGSPGTRVGAQSTLLIRVPPRPLSISASTSIGARASDRRTMSNRSAADMARPGGSAGESGATCGGCRAQSAICGYRAQTARTVRSPAPRSVTPPGAAGSLTPSRVCQSSVQPPRAVAGVVRCTHAALPCGDNCSRYGISSDVSLYSGARGPSSIGDRGESRGRASGTTFAVNRFQSSSAASVAGSGNRFVTSNASRLSSAARVGTAVTGTGSVSREVCSAIDWVGNRTTR